MMLRPGGQMEAIAGSSATSWPSQRCSRNLQRIRPATAPGGTAGGAYQAAEPPKRGLALAATVLVADDDADIVRFVEIYLRLEGFEVVTARDGPDVLARPLPSGPTWCCSMS
jgi:hypothetical protein